MQDLAESQTSRRWNLGQLMVWIALFAVVFAVLGLVASGLLWLVFTPVLLAPRGEKLARLYWIGVFFPWLFALMGCFTDRRLELEAFSRSLILQDVAGKSSVNGIDFLMFILLFSTPFVMIALIPATLARIARPSRVDWNKLAQVYEMFIILPVWLLGSCLILEIFLGPGDLPFVVPERVKSMSDDASQPTTRWNLMYVMVLIALLAVGFVVVGVPGAVLLAVISSPAWLARRGERWARLNWVLLFYPFFVVLWLYLVWFHAWFVLGHAPQSPFVAPEKIPEIAMTYSLMGMLLTSSPIVFLLALPLTIFRSLLRTMRVWPWLGQLFFLPFCYGSSYVLLCLDPFGAFGWYFFD